MPYAIDQQRASLTHMAMAPYYYSPSAPYIPPVTYPAKALRPAYRLYDLDRNYYGDSIRLVFAFGGVPYKDKRLSEEQWTKMKDQMPMKQLPILRVNDKWEMFQPYAILRYLGQEFQLYGQGSQDRAVVDVILESHRPFQERLFDLLTSDVDAEQRKANLTQFVSQHAKRYLDQMEKFYRTFHHRGPYYLGARISLADLIVYDTINHLIDIDSKLLDNYSHLRDARQRLEKHAQLTRYYRKIQKKRRAAVEEKSETGHD